MTAHEQPCDAAAELRALQVEREVITGEIVRLETWLAQNKQQNKLDWKAWKRARAEKVFRKNQLAEQLAPIKRRIAEIGNHNNTGQQLLRDFYNAVAELEESEAVDIGETLRACLVRYEELTSE